jgi:tRNA A37 methylthiotransferase MiaB
MQVAITGCGTLEKGALISESDFFSVYPELLGYREQIRLLGESPKKTATAETQPMWTKNFVVIQNGCDNHCAFCLTVLKR